MSQVKIQGNASGTGQFTIASPNSNNNQTLTLPDATGTVATTTDLSSLNASNLTSGTVPTARLATGTANSTTFLRGDQTWASATPSTADVLSATAGASVGAVGTYALLTRQNGAGATSSGSTRAGSELRYSSTGANISGTPSGTWRAMGYITTTADEAGGQVTSAVTLWLRTV